MLREQAAGQFSASELASLPQPSVPAGQRSCTEVAFGAGYERLSNGRDPWSSADLDLSHRFANEIAIYGGAATEKRFKIRDKTLSAGISLPLHDRIVVPLEAATGGGNKVLPQWTLVGRAQFELSQGFILGTGYKRNQYLLPTVDIATFSAEKYRSNYRASVAFDVVSVENSHPVYSRSAALDYYYGDRSFVGIFGSTGSEAEFITGQDILTRHTRAFVARGRHWLNDSAALELVPIAQTLVMCSDATGAALGLDGDIDATLALARSLALGTVALAVVLAVVTLIIRAKFILNTRAQTRILDSWRPVIAAALLGDLTAAHTIKLHRSNAVLFLLTCHHRHTQLRGEALKNLNTFARMVGATVHAWALLKSRNSRERLSAIILSGEREDVDAWDELTQLLHDVNPIVSLASARAMLQIDLHKVTREVLQAVLLREDWAPTRVASIVKDTGSATMFSALLETLSAARPAQLPRLLPLLDALECRVTLDATMEALDKSDELETVAACLRVIDDPRGLSIVRWYVTDER